MDFENMVRKQIIKKVMSFYVLLYIEMQNRQIQICKKLVSAHGQSWEWGKDVLRSPEYSLAGDHMPQSEILLMPSQS